MTAIALEAGQFQLGVVQTSELVKCGCEFTVDVYVSNRSPIDLKSKPPFPVHLSYHWFDAQGKECLIFDGRRTQFTNRFGDSRAETTRWWFSLRPSRGRYLLRVTLVQEQVQWFDSGEAHAACDTWVLVS